METLYTVRAIILGGSQILVKYNPLQGSIYAVDCRPGQVKLEVR